MPTPVLISLPLAEERHGGVSYTIKGELVPSLEVEMSGTSVYFEHHVLLWKDPRVDIELKVLDGAFKRMMAGMPIFLTQTATNQGRIAFSRDGAGHVFAIHLHPGEAIDVREHQFLAATNTVHYHFQWVKGLANIFFSASGLFIDTFSCKQEPGVLWLHGYGNVMEVMLSPGEQIDVEPGAWIYKDPTVRMETKMQSLSAGLFASGGQLVWNRFTGPGRLGLQTMSPYSLVASS
jgi:uncharacterized protein (AIM24 family)